jgi:hypothetical protein
MRDEGFHRYLVELYRADDQARAEHAEWMAERRAAEEALVRKNAEAEELERRSYEIEQATAAVAESDEELEPFCFNDEQFDVLADAFAKLHREGIDWAHRYSSSLLKASK